MNVNDTANGTGCKQRVQTTGVHPWALGGALLSSLSASADALLTDGSKAVRAKALTCSLRILEAHGDDIDSGARGDGVVDAGESPSSLDGVKETLSAVRC